MCLFRLNYLTVNSPIVLILKLEKITSFWYMITLSTLLLAQGNATARYEIDAKRIGVNPLDKDALPRSREFIRLDSTYYVGYLYEGIYKYDKSSDIIGFKNAIAPLRKAFKLFSKDYGSLMKTIFISPVLYIQNTNKYVDFLQMANTLKECYDNTEQPDSVMWVLEQVAAYDFPKDHLGINTTKAWTYHRNRFFTKDKYSFLKNTVAENEQSAFTYCYTALSRIEKNRIKNDLWFGPSQAETDKLNVYHYLALLHAYIKNYDSSEYYYQRMVQGGNLSWNNYGSLKLELGELSTAAQFYERDKFRYGQKVLKEPFYYIPMLNVLAGKTNEAMTLCKEAIADNGSSPGFGWYNLALGRSYLYNGQLDSAEYVIQKAADFKEIHIGTTLTQSQYDFTVNLLKLQLIVRKIALVKFENKGWWYSPTSLYNLAALKLKKNLLQYILVNEMAVNPERNRTVYDLFCGESTTTFDEAFFLIKDFTPAFFIKKYDNYQRTDKRKNIQRYFQLVDYNMQWQNGDEEIAYKGYKQLIKEVSLDTTAEKLFLARLYEGLAKGSDETGNGSDYDFYANTLYECYPQMLPFSGVKSKIKLNTSGIENETIAAVVKELKKTNIEWVNDADGNTLVATLDFKKMGEKYQATLTVKSGTNKTVVNGEKLIFKKGEGVGKEIALRMFGKSGGLVFEVAG